MSSKGRGAAAPGRSLACLLLWEPDELPPPAWVRPGLALSVAGALLGPSPGALWRQLQHLALAVVALLGSPAAALCTSSGLSLGSCLPACGLAPRVWGRRPQGSAAAQRPETPSVGPRFMLKAGGVSGPPWLGEGRGTESCRAAGFSSSHC